MRKGNLQAQAAVLCDFMSQFRHPYELTLSIPLLIPTCGSLHLAVNTRDWTCTSKISAMLGTQISSQAPRCMTAM